MHVEPVPISKNVFRSKLTSVLFDLDLNVSPPVLKRDFVAVLQIQVEARATSLASVFAKHANQQLGMRNRICPRLSNTATPLFEFKLHGGSAGYPFLRPHKFYQR